MSVASGRSGAVSTLRVQHKPFREGRGGGGGVRERGWGRVCVEGGHQCVGGGSGELLMCS